MTTAKLALRNVRKSLRDYTIYFLTLTFGVCVFYIFNALGSQEAVMRISDSQAALFRELSNILAGISVFVSVILGFLILYANRFMIRRRKKEFGVYMLLGMEKGAMSRILIAETVFVGILSLITGLAVGVLLSQGMAVLTSKLMNVPLLFRFVVAPDAIIKTAVYFGLIFLFVLVFNTIMMNKQKLIDLIYASKKNERFKTPRLALSVALFIVAAGCLFYAYRTALTSEVSELIGGDKLPLIVAIAIAGTFLFFFSLSGFFIKIIQRNKNVYLKGLNMFILRQIGSKINTTYVSMTVVCLMLFVSVCTLSSGLGLSSDIARNMNKNTPFDATIVTRSDEVKDGDTSAGYKGLDLAESIDASAAPMGSFAKGYIETRYYDAGVTIPLTVVQNNFADRIEANTYVLKLSDYNSLLREEGKEPIELSKGGYAVNSAISNAEYRDAIRSYMEENKGIIINGTQLETTPDDLYDHTLEVSRNEDYNLTLIVADSLIKGLPPARDVLNIDYQGSGEQTATYDGLLTDAAEALKASGAEGVWLSTETATDVRALTSSATTLVTYIAIYLGIIFLIAAAAVLAIGQLSEVSDNIGRYDLLRKLGTDEKMLHRSIFAQNLIYFGAPMLLAVIHAIVGVLVASRLILAFDKGDTLAGSLLVTAIFIVVYGGYFLATYQGGKGILNRESASARAE
ncbi:MAG: ABC transporter permease [Clostridiales Family XIII bacterium]|jgi:putative ABC transport system permease protein|nr:ABC transporter permease [Clostridiales Family XIII bacterium]